MLVVAALGGNALLRAGDVPSIDTQRTNVRAAVRPLAAIAHEHALVVTHGNGPQVGLLDRQGRAEGTTPYPLDVLDAATEGTIGYLIESELRSALPAREVVTLLTQVVVDRLDPAFGHPTKPIGLAPDRRVVPSPEPVSILELRSIHVLVDAGTIVVCAGGGGIPVCIDDLGRVHGVDAVVDKDSTAALLAIGLHADALLLLTDVAGVIDGDDLRHDPPLRAATIEQLRAMDLPAGSMGPKAEAACRFVENTGKVAAIGALADAAEMLRGRAGTIVRQSKGCGCVGHP